MEIFGIHVHAFISALIIVFTAQLCIFDIARKKNQKLDEFLKLISVDDKLSDKFKWWFMTSFAIGLALADLAETQVEGSSHFLILDEPFMALDGRNCENIVNYLSGELAQKRETILLISNEDSLQSLISNRIHIVKSGGVSRLGTIGATNAGT